MEKKVYTVEKFIETVTAPIDSVKRQLVLAGNNLMNLNSKSEQELRQMILDYVTVNEDEFFQVMGHGNLETTVGLQKAMIQLGLPTEKLYKRLGFAVELSDETKKTETSEKEMYLFHTEELYERIVEEFLTSELPAQERVTHFIESVKHLKQAYTNYAVQTPGFNGGERYREVFELFQTIPKVEMYKQDESVGDYINIARAKAYYEEVARQLAGGFGIGDNNTPKKL